MTATPELPFTDPHDPQISARGVITVTELTSQIRTILESSFTETWVEGEIADSRLWKTGHLYFTLRDEHAQLKAVMFRSAVRYLRFTPEDGLRVVARGRVSVYEPKGEYQIVCEHLQPQGIGALQVAFEQVKRKLKNDGLFGPERKRPLPLLPRQIGVVTSLDGAALRDILQVLTRRHQTAHVVIYPTRVQGDGAAEKIAEGIARLSQTEGIDVIIVGRGGGSLEDLWAFNEERVARAIAAAAIPVISAVGHETDVTLSDFVADVRAPTPSAAAELAIAGRTDLVDRVDQLTGRLRAGVLDPLRRSRTRVLELDRRPGLMGWPARLASHGRHTAELTHAISSALRKALASRLSHVHAVRIRLDTREPGRRVEATRTRLVAARERLSATLAHRRQKLRNQVSHLTGRLEALSPLGVLARGYAVCWDDEQTRILRDSATVSVGDNVAIKLARGRLSARVTGKN